jgi:hypothetical protein
MSSLCIVPSRLASGVILTLTLLMLAGCGSSSSGGGTPPPPPPPPPASNTPFWAQWGFSPQHDGDVPVAAQALNTQLADIVYDPFVTKEQAEFGGDLVAHYPSPLIDGSDFYIEMKTGTYTSCNPPENWVNGDACGPNTWNRMTSPATTGRVARRCRSGNLRRIGNRSRTARV